MANDSTPVIIGVGRLTQRARDIDVGEALDPIGLMAAAARKAAADASVGSAVDAAALFAHTDSVSTVMLIMEERVPKERGPLYKNPPLGLAKSLGVPTSARCAMSYHGGDKPQLVVNDMADYLASGGGRLGIVAGGECLDTFMRATKLGRAPAGIVVRDAVGRATDAKTAAGAPLAWGDDQSVPEPVVLGHVERVATKQEARHGLASPPNTYAMLDQALRHHLGRSAEEHNRSNAALFAGLSEVAATTEGREYAWFPTARSADELATVSAENRAVTMPGFPKYLNAAQDVDQAAAVILATVSLARELGVPEDRWIYLHGCAEAEEAPVNVSERPELHRSRALEAVGREVQRSANVPLSKCEALEIYSCFPVAVQVACRELGIDEVRAKDGRSLTLLGGLPYHGGPGNSYALHGIVAMCESVRAKPGSFGLVTANGGFLTKHSAGIYSTTPYSVTHPGQKWQRRPPKELQAEVNACAEPLVLSEAPSGLGTIETCTVEFGRQGPVRALFLGRLQSDPCQRFVATNTDKATMDLVMAGNGIGITGTVTSSGGRNVFTPSSVNSKL